jgi:hypothetical protein
MNKINFTYSEKHEQICNTLNYRCPSAITATVENCSGCVHIANLKVINYIEILDDTELIHIEEEDYFV